MIMFNFKRLVRKYSNKPVYYLQEEEGYHDPTQGGKWINGAVTPIKLDSAAIVPLSNNDLQFSEGGTYVDSDRKLYCYKSMVKGNKIKHDGNRYSILEDKDYADFDDGLYIYIVRRGDRD